MVDIAATSVPNLGQSRCVVCVTRYGAEVWSLHSRAPAGQPLSQRTGTKPALPCAAGDPCEPTDADADGASLALHRTRTHDRAEVVYVCHGASRRKPAGGYRRPVQCRPTLCTDPLSVIEYGYRLSGCTQMTPFCLTLAGVWQNSRTREYAPSKPPAMGALSFSVLREGSD